MTKEELDKILYLHRLWLEFNPEGKRANLSEANLSRANLSEADLTGANFTGTIYENDVPIMINTEY